MPTWALLRLVTFNLTLFLIGIIFAVVLYRNRRRRVAIVGILVASIVSVMLIAFTQYKVNFLITLACTVLFLHLPLWLSIVAILLWRCHRLVSVLCIAFVIILGAIVCDAFLIEPTALGVTYYEIEDSRIEEPMRIVVIADFQADEIGDYERYTLQTALEQEPDLILFAGDYFSYGTAQEGYGLLTDFQELLEELQFDAPLGVYAVRGNVDSYLPWHVAFGDLKGSRVDRRTRSFEVGGVHLTCLAERSSFNPNLNLSRPDEDRFHIVLGHCPNYALGRVDADLLLAGHTHGGQICLPVLGPLTTGCSVPRSWASGMTLLPGLSEDISPSSYALPATDRRLIVSRGTGMERGTAPRIRFFCRPELVVIDLQPKKRVQAVQTSVPTPD